MDDLREILLTLSPGQYDAFVGDLIVLRDGGADSNTEAIIEAVRERADRVRVAAVNATAAA